MAQYLRESYIPNMKIGTWNVAYGRGPTVNARRRKEMAVHQADVWVLTETHESLSLGESFDHFDSDPRPVEARLVDDKSHWVTIWVRRDLKARILKVEFDTERTVACEIETPNRPLVIFGTVLPWYNDTKSYDEQIAGQSEDWNRLESAASDQLCVAGDFNVNVGGDHYYGSRLSRLAVEECLNDSRLKLVTNYDATKSCYPDHGLIDHVAISTNLASSVVSIDVLPKRDRDGRPLSDHCGVVVQLEL